MKTVVRWGFSFFLAYLGAEIIMVLVLSYPFFWAMAHGSNIFYTFYRLLNVSEFMDWSFLVYFVVIHLITTFALTIIFYSRRGVVDQLIEFVLNNLVKTINSDYQGSLQNDCTDNA